MLLATAQTYAHFADPREKASGGSFARITRITAEDGDDDDEEDWR
jgi:hypothetical protein